MKKTKLFPSILILTTIFVFLPMKSAFALTTQGGNAEIYFTPTTNTVTPGTPFTVSLYVDSKGSPSFNAVQANVMISDPEAVKSVQPGNCGLTFISQPTSKNLNFAGALLGKSSNACTVYTLTLSAPTAEIITAKISNESVKAYSNSAEEYNPTYQTSLPSPLPTGNSVSFVSYSEKAPASTFRNLTTNGSTSAPKVINGSVENSNDSTMLMVLVGVAILAVIAAGAWIFYKDRKSTKSTVGI